MFKFVMVGTGKVGLTMARAFRSCGCQQLGIVSRTGDRAQTVANLEQVHVGATNIAEFNNEPEWIFLAVPDSYIASVCEQIVAQGKIGSKHTLVHFSGALTSQELNSASQRGARVLSLHPLKSFASSDDTPASLKGTLFAIEGDQTAVDVASKLVEQLDGIPFGITKQQKTLYHAAAVVASNYLVSLSDLAAAMLQHVGIPREYGLPGLLALSQGVFNNINKVGTVEALTGPIARGDITTVTRHLAALAETPAWQQIYKVLGLYTVDIAEAKGTVDEMRSQALKQVLTL